LELGTGGNHGYVSSGCTGAAGIRQNSLKPRLEAELGQKAKRRDGRYMLTACVDLGNSEHCLQPGGGMYSSSVAEAKSALSQQIAAEKPAALPVWSGVVGR
jgi:hypothetical protein